MPTSKARHWANSRLWAHAPLPHLRPAGFASGASAPSRGPRRRTRENPAGLTARELQVLVLLDTDAT